MRTWQMYVWTGKRYEKPTSDGTVEARTPADAMRRFGLDHDLYTPEYSRKGYGHFTGVVRLYSPEALAAREVGPVPADFVLRVID